MWKLIKHFHRGHRLFRWEEEGSPNHHRYAIADISGKTPDQTEDGILWLDRDRPIKDNGGDALLPVILHSDGTPKVALIAWRVALWMSWELGFEIDVREREETLTYAAYRPGADDVLQRLKERLKGEFYQATLVDMVEDVLAKTKEFGLATSDLARVFEDPDAFLELTEQPGMNFRLGYIHGAADVLGIPPVDLVLKQKKTSA